MVEVESNGRKIAHSADGNRRCKQRYENACAQVQSRKKSKNRVDRAPSYELNLLEAKYEQNYSAKLYCLVPSSTSAPVKDHVDQP